MPGRKTGRRVSCGNAGAVESVESQKQAYHPFHEPLGNPAKRRRDSHISTAPAARADGKVENQKQVFRFPTAPRIDWERINKKHAELYVIPVASGAVAGESLMCAAMQMFIVATSIGH